MKNITILFAAAIALASCGGPTAEEDAAAEARVNNQINADVETEITTMEAAQEKLRAAEAKQQQVTASNMPTSDNVDVSVQDAMTAARQTANTTANAAATTEQYLANGAN